MKITVQYLHQTNNLPLGKHCLDVGSHNFDASKALLGLGYDVVAVDPSDKFAPNMPREHNFEFKQTTIEEYLQESPTEKYDLILANNVLPFTTSQIHVFKSLANRLSENGVIGASLWLHRHAWAAKRSTNTPEELRRVIQEYSDAGFRVIYESWNEGDAMTMMNQVVHWHSLELALCKS